MKRFYSILLALCLVLSLAAPALAAEEIDTGMLTPGVDAPEVAAVPTEDDSTTDLAKLTAQVKQTLDIDDGYTNFYSDYNDGLTPRWSLNWSDDAHQTSVDVTPEGKIMNVSCWTNSAAGRDFFNGFDPAFPPLTDKEAEDQAESWYGRLFTGKESGRTELSRVYLGTEGVYRYYGTVDLNGLPSPITFSLSVAGHGLDSFYRSDAYMGYVGIVPDPVPAVAEADAARALYDAAALELRYVSDGEGGAALRYVPIGARTVVDAQSGDAVDMDALYESIGGGAEGYGVAMNADAAAVAAEPEATLDSGLTEVELASIENYAGVLDQAALDEILQALPALGLEGFTPERCSYSMTGEDGDVTASLRYLGTMTEDALCGFSKAGYDQAVAEGRDLTVFKYITLDAKSGEVKAVRTSYPLWEKDPAVTMAKKDKDTAAEAFLTAALPERMAETALCTLSGYEEDEDSVFAQIHEGYFYPDNCLRVTVNPASGTVDAFSVRWEDVEFGPAGEPVDMDAALGAYTDALDVTLGYVAWPLDLAKEENEIYSAYQMWGYTYVEELRLAYYYDGTDRVYGVDALTGEPVKDETTEGIYGYEDLAGVPQADMIAALGRAGVGFDGEKFLPEQAVTVRDAVVLLLRAGGSSVSEQDDESLLDQACYQGFLKEKSWEPEEELTGDGFLRMMLGASRYGDAAELLEDGYDQIARALGLAPADGAAPLTRAEAAEMLYTFMER